MRTAQGVTGAKESSAVVEGMTHRSPNCKILVVLGGLAYVADLPRWTAEEATTPVRVEGIVRRGPAPL